MKMLIVIGPQGSGNHLFGKIFSLHNDVHGWKAALEPDGYFIPHWYEPFNEFWNNPNKITVDIMGGKQYAVTSVSNPYMENFVARVPLIEEFTQKLKDCGIESQLAIIGRDRNILDLQQRRLRGGPTWGMMQIMLNRIEEPPLFISQELLYLYRNHYVRSLGKWLDFPVAWNDSRIDEILIEDANAKYIKPCEPTELDTHVKNFIKPDWLKVD